MYYVTEIILYFDRLLIYRVQACTHLHAILTVKWLARWLLISFCIVWICRNVEVKHFKQKSQESRESLS